MPTPLPETWTTTLAAWQRAMERDHLSPRTIEQRRYGLRPFALAHPHPFTVTPGDAAAWLADPDRWSPVDPKLMRSTLHRFYAWAAVNGLIATNPAPTRGRTHAPLSPAWDGAITDYRTAERESGHAESTVVRRCRHLDLFATTSGTADPWTVTAADLAAWVRSQDWTATTAASARTALRTFYEWATNVGRTASNPAAYLCAMAVTRDPRPVGTRGPAAHAIPDPWAGPLRLFGRHLLARGQSRNTAKLRDAHLRRLARDLAPLDPWAVTFDDLMDWISRIPANGSTRRSIRSSLVTFYAWAIEAGHIDTDPARRLPSIRATAPNPHPVSENAIRAAMLVADSRERLMLRLGAELGMRRAEVAQARTSDLIERDGGWSLLVHGKGARDRVLPLPEALATTMRAMPPGYLFPSGSSSTGHLTAASVGKLIGDLLPEGVSAHALRHRFATRAYELDHDVFAVQRLLGHARPETTQGYVATGDAQLRSTVDRLAAWTDAQRISA